MSIAERLGEGLVVLAIGMIVVFGVLIILWGVLALFKVFFYDMPNKKKQKVDSIKEKQPEIQQTTVEVAQEDDEELIAVITAAIAASMNTSSSNLRIKSLRRISNWKKENGGY